MYKLAETRKFSFSCVIFYFIFQQHDSFKGHFFDRQIYLNFFEILLPIK